MSDESTSDEVFWGLAAPLLARPDTAEGKIMSSRCLRVNGDFCAMVARSGDLVVKLPAERVLQLIDSGSGQPFAPAGKVFKEWLAVPAGHEEGWELGWQKLLRESHAFILG